MVGHNTRYLGLPGSRICTSFISGCLQVDGMRRRSTHVTAKPANTALRNRQVCKGIVNRSFDDSAFQGTGVKKRHSSRLTLQCSHFVPTQRVDAEVATAESLGCGPQIGTDRAAARPVLKLPQHAGVGGRSARRPLQAHKPYSRCSQRARATKQSLLHQFYVVLHGCRKSFRSLNIL
jgi:hypothetical protein